MIAPRPGDVLTGIVELAVAVDPMAAGTITFQYSPDALIWTDIDAAAFPYTKQSWAARWDTSAAPPGPLHVRAVLQAAGGLEVISPAVLVRLARLPIALVAANVLPGGTVEFDGSESTHPDPAGRIEYWIWDFGDGTSEVGPVVSHSYDSLEASYSGSLTVVDGDGNRSAAYFAVNFLLTPGFKAEDKCVCKAITLRGQTPPQNSLGPKGDGSKSWPALEDEADGKTLGPLAKNPDNKSGVVGYAFEIAVDVEGDPGKCKEIQVAKFTTAWTDIKKENCTDPGDIWDDVKKTCTTVKVWTGKKKDLDLDGTDDIDVSTKAKCTAAGGTFDEANGRCTLKFPYSVKKFGPDETLQGEAGGAYESPYSHKVHVGKQILWFDHPNLRSGGVGTTGDWSFVSFIRGTDAKYCYVAFTTNVKKEAAGVTEAIKQTGTGVGKDSVPDVP